MRTWFASYMLLAILWRTTTVTIWSVVTIAIRLRLLVSRGVIIVRSIVIEIIVGAIAMMLTCVFFVGRP